MIQQHLLPAGLRELDFTPVIIQHGRQRGRIQEQLKRKRKKERGDSVTRNQKDWCLTPTGNTGKKESCQDTGGNKRGMQRSSKKRKGWEERWRRGWNGGRKKSWKRWWRRKERRREHVHKWKVEENLRKYSESKNKVRPQQLVHLHISFLELHEPRYEFLIWSSQAQKPRPSAVRTSSLFQTEDELRPSMTHAKLLWQSPGIKVRTGTDRNSDILKSVGEFYVRFIGFRALCLQPIKASSISTFGFYSSFKHEPEIWLADQMFETQIWSKWSSCSLCLIHATPLTRFCKKLLSTKWRQKE